MSSRDPYLKKRWLDKINPEQYDTNGRIRHHQNMAKALEPAALAIWNFHNATSYRARHGNSNDSNPSACSNKDQFKMLLLPKE